MYEHWFVTMNNMQVHVCVYVRMSDCVCVCVECVFMYVCGSVLRVYSFMCVGLCVIYQIFI